ncbi:LuxR C-terminal-related transcriptional regulator [Streptomyces sp. NPDC002690]
MTRLEPEEALAFLREQAVWGRAGAGRLILVSGGVASGKTWLLDEFVDYCVRQGVRTLSAVGAADEQGFAGGVLKQLLVGVECSPGEQGAPDGDDPVLAHHGLGRIRSSGGPDGDALRSWAARIERLAREEPLALVVDDVHLADDASLLVLRRIQRRLRTAPLTMVLGFRDAGAAGDRGRQFTWGAHLGIRLAPWSEERMREILGDRVFGGASLLARQLSCGIPMLTAALAEDSIADEADEAGADGGTEYVEALGRYLDRWDPPLREAAGRLAAFGEPFPARAEQGTGGPVGVVAAESLDRSGLLADGWFRHPGIAEAVLRGLTPEARAAAHLRAAELKTRLVAEPREVAAHLLAAGSPGPDWAPSVLRRAAEQAMDQATGQAHLAPETAVPEADFARQCLELAVESAGSDAERRTILADLARRAWRSSPSAGQGYLDVLTDLMSDGLEQSPEQAAVFARAALWWGEEAVHRGSLPFGYDVLGAGALGPGKSGSGAAGEGGAGSGAVGEGGAGSWAGGPADVRAGSPPDFQAEALCRLAHRWWFGPVDAVPLVSAGAADPWLSAADDLSRIWSEPGGDASVAAAERLLDSCRLSDGTLEALMTAVLALVLGGRAEDAEDWWRTLKADADSRGAVVWQAVLTGMWSSAVLRGGDATYAAALARHALSLLPDRDWGAAVADPLATLLAARTAAGEYERAAEVVARGIPDGLEHTVGGIRFLRSRGRYHLATGRPLAAVGDFTRIGRILGARGTDLPGLAPWRADLAEAHLALGDACAARDLATEQLARAVDTDLHTRALALRVLAVAGPPEELHRSLREPAELFAARGDRAETLRTVRMLDRMPWQDGTGPGGRSGVLTAIASVDRGLRGPRGLVGVAGRRDQGGRLPEPADPADPAGPPDRPGPLSLVPAERPTSHRVAARITTPVRAVAGGPESTVRTEPEAGGAETLSEAERRVAGLAVQGLTNQEISGVLAVTVSTVEQHLTRVYRKLGVRGRADLAAGLGN